MKKSVYGLMYDDPTHGLVVFYVGCTNDVVRRTQEHMRNPFNPKHSEYDTMKYQFCRDLAELDLTYRLEVISDQEEVDDEADEYSWILQFARHNEDHDIAFYEGMPLTNMKAGDFLDEMLRDRTVKTAGEIRQFVKHKREQRVSSYQRANHNTSVFNAEGRRVLAQAQAKQQEHNRLKAEREEKKQRRKAKRDQEYDTWLTEQRALFEIERNDK